MNIYLIKYPVHYLGRGKRIAIWTIGCPHHCYNCVAANLWVGNEKYEIDIPTVLNELAKYPGRPGITFTGGEPLIQPDFLPLLEALREANYNDILVYSGFTLEEINNDEEKRKILPKVDVLIEGRYIDELNDNRPLRGSSNQRVIIFNKDHIPDYTKILNGERQYEIEYNGETFNIYGVVPKGYLELIAANQRPKKEKQ